MVAAAAVAALAAGAGLELAGRAAAANAVWVSAVAALLIPLGWSVARSLRRGDVGVDSIALLAMAGAIVLGEYLAGAVIAVMLSGGNALEAYAARRARRELTLLVGRAPRVAGVRRDQGVVQVPVEPVAAGDVVVVRSGEVLAADGRLISAEASVDEAALTGESRPVTALQGDEMRSGATNVGAPFELRASRPASESAYAALVRLVQRSQATRAPFVRLADGYAPRFLAFTLVTAAAAWAVSGDPVRALAVLVVATPCPLILAAPVALVSGVSAAARRGVIVKGAPAIEVAGPRAQHAGGQDRNGHAGFAGGRADHPGRRPGG
jgi:cation transport ATPase